MRTTVSHLADRRTALTLELDRLSQEREAMHNVSVKRLLSPPPLSSCPLFSFLFPRVWYSCRLVYMQKLTSVLAQKQYASTQLLSMKRDLAFMALDAAATRATDVRQDLIAGDGVPDLITTCSVSGGDGEGGVSPPPLAPAESLTRLLVPADADLTQQLQDAAKLLAALGIDAQRM
jgi:hypothetical protein